MFIKIKFSKNIDKIPIPKFPNYKQILYKIFN